MKKGEQKKDWYGITVQINNKIEKNKEYTQNELQQILAEVGLPKSPVFISKLVEYSLFTRVTVGPLVAFKAAEFPIYYQKLHSAYTSFRKKVKEYHQNSTPKEPEEPKKEEDLEAKIQEALKLLKAQGDRFLIQERKVSYVTV